MPSSYRTAAILLLAALGCADSAPGDRADVDARSPTSDTPAAEPSTAPAPQDRASRRVDTIGLEGTASLVPVRLFTADESFPIAFSAYVPEDMSVEQTATDSTASVHFRAEFGGQRNPDAYVHLFVFPAGTDRQSALALAESYVTSRGVPVSQGLEPLPSTDAEARMPWAIEAWTFEHQSDSGWYFGSLGVGQRQGRHFQIVRHYPAEYGDGFGPRARLIENSWRWADGTRLNPDPEP